MLSLEVGTDAKSILDGSSGAMTEKKALEKEAAKVLGQLLQIVEPRPWKPAETSTWQETTGKPIDLRKRY
jgi:hypothetical protein